MALFVGSVAYGFFIGRSRIVTIFISIYIALAIVIFFPYLGILSQVKSSSIAYLQVAIFFSILIALYLLLTTTGIFRSGYGGNIETAIMSILQVGLIISIVLFLLPQDFSNSLPKIINALFNLGVSRFIWISTPILALVFIRKR